MGGIISGLREAAPAEPGRPGGAEPGPVQEAMQARPREVGVPAMAMGA
jgi:hypothetical protein